ncbi:MAG: hypothetical protein M1820_009232 [Bogoriella megaspora]|nr:MAG: hypothetical protein M1820_009232 [Bogoriella megaspora]
MAVVIPVYRSHREAFRETEIYGMMHVVSSAAYQLGDFIIQQNKYGLVQTDRSTPAQGYGSGNNNVATKFTGVRKSGTEGWPAAELSVQSVGKTARVDPAIGQIQAPGKGNAGQIGLGDVSSPEPVYLMTDLSNSPKVPFNPAIASPETFDQSPRIPSRDATFGVAILGGNRTDVF